MGVSSKVRENDGREREMKKGAISFAGDALGELFRRKKKGQGKDEPNPCRRKALTEIDGPGFEES